MPSHDRQFLLRWRRGVFNAGHDSSAKLTLLALAEFADAEGGDCYPSIEAVAALASLSSRTVRAVLNLENAWFTRTKFKRAGQAWNGYLYQLVIPEGAATNSARSREGAATVAAASQATTGKSDRKVRQLTAEGAAAVADEQEKQEKQQEEQSGKRLSPGDVVTFKAWWEAMPDEDWRKLRDRCCSYMDSIQVDPDFFGLFERWVINRFWKDQQKRADWPEHVFRGLRDNWHKLWCYPSPDEPARLTTTGEQLRRREAA